jgi:hypothetical protein
MAVRTGPTAQEGKEGEERRWLDEEGRHKSKRRTVEN